MYAQRSRKNLSGTIDSGKTQTRESKDNSLDKFVRTKVSNLRDYTDACYRYLRATGMVEISQRGNSLSIMYEKKQEVEFFLDHVDRKPIFVDDEAKYKDYLFNASLSILYSDDRERLLTQVSEFMETSLDFTQIMT
ncbi:AlwI family type II restriction endonuclease [Petralouisia muris]|uniref:AlwI family type II restriction endonuclease n=1 Tax=Petralouisia muris TaxID=3032872 RepID=A0AC61S2D7_9FIRM|nr:AlwI family type II restriction endonuclease [Petralouisia muris]